MSKKTSGVKSRTVEMISRRKRVITMLETQLKKTTKNASVLLDGKKIQTTVPLLEKDIVRIKKELEILKTRI